MNDFKSWEEVEKWLERGEMVYYWSWCYSKSYMSCNDPDCGCEDAFDSAEEAVKSLKDRSSSRLHMIERLLQ